MIIVDYGLKVVPAIIVDGWVWMRNPDSKDGSLGQNHKVDEGSVPLRGKEGVFKRSRYTTLSGAEAKLDG